ncbi:MAG: hypothetical protein WCP01_15180, partial [Methylococcaceae bacterium]
MKNIRNIIKIEAVEKQRPVIVVNGQEYDHGQSESNNKSAFALTINKPASSLAVAIATLSGLLVVIPAEAAFNIPTATVDKVTGLFTPEPSP